MTVGSFDKTIAERLSEISLEASDNTGSMLSSDANRLEAGLFFDDLITIRTVRTSYTITGSSNALSRNSNMGFDDILGFTEEVGFEHNTVTKKEYTDSFYEQEGYK